MRSKASMGSGWPLAVIAACCTFIPTVRGDVLELKDGRVLKGQYTGGTQGTVRFKTAGADEVFATGEVVALTFTGSGAPATQPVATTAQPAAAAIPATAPAAQPAPQPITLPRGTPLHVRLVDSVSSNDKPGKQFAAVLEQPLMFGNTTVAPAGTKLYGKVIDAKKARRAVGKSKLTIELTDIVVKGKTVGIQTDDFSDQGSGSGKKTAGAAAVGAGIGAVVDGGEGAGKGAAIGAGVSLLKKGDSVVAPPNLLLQFHLEQPVTIQP